MKFEDAAEAVKNIPYTTQKKGRILYDLVRTNGYKTCLELGFAHGVGSIYIAAALATNGSGRVISVDNASARDRTPNIHTLAERTGLTSYIEPIFHSLGYTWYLMDHIESSRGPFDFCYLDGAHSWDVDGFAFLLVANLLRRDGLVIFDDLDWTYASSPSLKDRPMVKSMDARRKTTPQVRKVFELIACKDPRFECTEENGWGYARKIA